MSNKFMIRVRPFHDLFNVIEVPNTTPARAVDSAHYAEYEQVKYLGSNTPRPLEDFGSFSFVEIETGFEDVVGEATVVYVDPHNEHLVSRKRTLWPGDTALFIHESSSKQ
jgi:hypothetical protein